MEITYRKETYGQYSVDVFTIYQFGEQMYSIAYRHSFGINDFVTYINECNTELLEYFIKYSLEKALRCVANKLDFSYDKLKEIFFRDYKNLLMGIYH